MLAFDRPRFKQELVAEPIEENGARYIDLMDPDSGNLYRFYEVEYALACGMDGERDVAGIVRWAQEELGLSPSAKEVQTVISTLGDLGYLDARPAIETETARPAVEAARPEPARPAQKPAVEVAKAPAGKVDDDLARGIVVGQQSKVANPPVEDFELGASGGAPQIVQGDGPKAPDLALGNAGTSTAPKRPDPISAPDIALGASGAGEGGRVEKADLSMDLSDGFALRSDDVKEAVRASKVMTAVEMPKDLLDALEAKPPVEAKKPAEKPVEAKKPAEKAPEKKPAEKPVEAKKPAEKAPEKKPAEKAPVADAKKADAKKPAEKAPVADAKKATDKKPADKKAVELPKQVDKKAAVEEKKPVAPPAPKPGVSPVLIVLLVLAILGAGAFLVWKYVLDKPATETSETAPPKPVPPAPPAPPPLPTAKLAVEAPAPVALKFAQAGNLEWIEASDRAVKANDIVAKLAGNAALDGVLTAMRKDLEKPLADFAAAEQDQKKQQAGSDAAATKAATDKTDAARKALEAKQKPYVAKNAEYEKLIVRAPVDGKFTAVGKASTKVAETDVIGNVAPASVVTATFTVTDAAGYTAGSDVVLALKGSDKTLACKIAEVANTSVKAVCPADATIPADAEATLPK